MKIVDRYILKELVGPFLNGVVAFSAILVAGFILPKMVELLTGPQAMSIRDVGLVFFYRLPSILVMTFPMSTLLGALQGFGRLSGDSEIIVMRAGGISFSRMMAWVFVMGVLISAGTLWFNETLVPAANHQAENIVRTVLTKEEATSALVVQVPDSGPPRLVVVAQGLDIKSNTLRGVTMLQYIQNKVAAITSADKAVWEKDRGKWRFIKGYIQQVSEKGGITRTTFDQQVVELDQPPAKIQLEKLKADEMTYRQLRRYIDKIHAQGVDVLKYEVKLQQKLSLPLASLVLILIGAPLGLRPHRGGSAIGFGMAIMIAFFYFVVAHFLAAAGEGGSVSPLMAAWIPNIIGALTGMGLIIKAAR